MVQKSQKIPSQLESRLRHMIIVDRKNLTDDNIISEDSKRILLMESSHKNQNNSSDFNKKDPLKHSEAYKCNTTTAACKSKKFEKTEGFLEKFINDPVESNVKIENLRIENLKVVNLKAELDGPLPISENCNNITNDLFYKPIDAQNTQCEKFVNVAELDKSNFKIFSNAEWIKKRESLEIMKVHSEKNSPLKKKLLILNKLKNISNEKIDEILIELKSENLKKFYTEIVNNLLSNSKVTQHSDIHKIVSVIYLYSQDKDFIQLVTQSLKKVYSSSWVYGALFIEVFLLLNKNKSSDGVLKNLLKTYKDDLLLFIQYVLLNIEVEDKSIFLDYIYKESSNALSKNIDILNSIIAIAGLNVDVKMQEDFVEVIKVKKDEFSFYTKEYKPLAKHLVISDIKKIEENAFNSEFLDYISKNIANSPELISKVLKKKRKFSIAPAIARILSRLPKERKDLVQSVLKTEKANKAADTNEDILLFSELYKFGCIKNGDFFTLLNSLFDNKQIEKLIIVLETTGRFLLSNRDTNYSTRMLIEKIKQTSFKEMEKTMINECFGKIFQSDQFGVNICDFVHWFFKAKNFQTAGIFENLQSDRRFLSIIFMQPEFFEDSKMLYEIILQSNMIREVYNFYTESLVDAFAYSKQRFFVFVEVLGYMVENKEAHYSAFAQDKLFELPNMDKKSRKLDIINQDGLIKTIINLPLDEEVILKSLLIILDHTDVSVHQKYLEYVRSGTSNHSNIKPLLFNFCEKYSYSSYESAYEEDSFDFEMEALKEENLRF